MLPAASPRKDREIGLYTVESGERHVSVYSPDLMLQICERIAGGETLKAICEAADMPHQATVRRWVLNYPEAARAYAAAREMSAHSLEERALEMAFQLEAGRVGKDQIRAYDVAMTQLRWSAGKRNPRVYSDKLLPVSVMGIQINTSLDLGEGGGSAPQGVVSADGRSYTIEAVVIEPDSEEPRHPNTVASTEGEKPLVVTKHRSKPREDPVELPASAEGVDAGIYRVEGEAPRPPANAGPRRKARPRAERHKARPTAYT